MAIIWADFPSGQLGLYGTSTANMLNGVWAEIVIPSNHTGTVTLVNDPDPNIAGSGTVLRTRSGGSVSGSVGPRFALPSPANTEGIGLRLWMSALPQNNSTTPFVAFRNGANATLFAIKILSTGAIEARSTQTTGGTLYGTTTGPVVTANSYNHIEVKGLADASAGTIEVRVNGVTVLNLTGLDTGTGPIAQFLFGYYNITTGNPADNAYWKDVVFWDTSGAEGNDFQGSVAVHDLYTDADISLNWTPSTGSTGWDLIDETTPNDTDYIQAGDPAPAAAVFSLTDLPEDVTSVRALLPIYRATKTDGGDCNIQVGITPNNTNWDDGADRPMTTAYTYWWDVSHLSPATAAPWTPVEVNAAYVRADRTL